MARNRRNQEGSPANSEQELKERLNRRGEDVYGEGEPRYGDQEPGKQPYKPSEQQPEPDEPAKESPREPAKDPADKLTGQREENFGGPYDVGAYASHYDEKKYPPGEQRDLALRKQGRFRGKGPRGYQRPDKRILEDVNDKLYLDPYIDASGIEVQVNKCDVVLTGAVENREAKRRAEELAESIPGVKNVENRLRVEKMHTVGPERSSVREGLT